MKLRDIFASARNGFKVPDHSSAARRVAEQRRADSSVTRANRARGRGGNEEMLRRLGGNEAWARVPAALGSVALIARICASVPIYLAREMDDGFLEPVKPGSGGPGRGDEEFARVLRRPNRHQSPFDFYNTVFSQLKAYGNCYIWIKPGPPKELFILNGRNVETRLTLNWAKEYRYRSYRTQENSWRTGVPRGGVSGSELIDPITGAAVYGSEYSTSSSVLQHGLLSLPLPGKSVNGHGQAILREHEVIHVRDQSMDPLVGVSPAAQYARTFGLHSAVELIASEFAAVGGRKPILVSARDPSTPDDKLDDVRSELEARANFESSVFVAGGDFSVMEFGTGMDNMDEARTASLHDIWRAYGVPPTYGGKEDADNSTKSAEETTRVFLQTCVIPAQKAVADAFRDGLAPDWHHKTNPPVVVFDNSRLTRASLIGQTQHFEKMLAGGVISPNEVRLELGMKPRKGGDKYYDPEKTMTNQGGRPNKDGSERSDSEKSRRQRSDGESEGPRS